MTICRKEYFEGSRIYELKLTPQIVGEFNLYLLNRVEGTFNPVTEEDIVAIYKGGKLENNQIVRFKSSNYDSNMEDVIRDYFTEELWNSYCEYGDENTFESEDYVRK